MKTLNIKITYQLLLLGFLALGMLGITACSKESSQEEVFSGNSKIMVRISGVTDGKDVHVKVSSTGAPQPNAANHSVKLIENEGFDALIATDNNIPGTVAKPINQIGLSATAGTKGLRAAALANNIKYRMFLYKKTGDTYSYSESFEFAVGTEIPVEIPQGRYKWVALSYNNTTDPIPDRGLTDSLTLPTNTDVLYGSSTTDLVISGDEIVPVYITFNRLYARVAVELNAEGLFATFKSAVVTVDGQNAKGGTVNLQTGQMGSKYSDETTPALAYTNFENVEATDNSRKIAYFYTADPTAQNIAVNLTNVVVTLENGAERDFGTAKVQNTVNLAPIRGQNHRILVGMSESALTFGDVKWSRSNLYYKTGSRTPYRFNASNLYNATADENSYFSFKGHIPRKFASSVPANQKDPCALVYPAQLWKTPSKPDLDDIQNSEGVLGNLLNTLGDLLLLPGTPGADLGANYIEFTPTAGVSSLYGAATSPENKLRFNYNGLQTNIALVEGLIALNLGSSKGGQAAFWTETELLNAGTLLTIGAWSYLGYTGGLDLGLLGSIDVARGAAGSGLLNLNLGGLSLVNSALMNVRCVRNPDWNTISTAPNYNPNPAL